MRPCPSIYLAGPISGTLSQGRDPWRRIATAAIHQENSIALDPVRFGLDPKTDGPQAVVYFDLTVLSTADALLIDATHPTWGGAMELLHAYQARIPTIGFTVLEGASPSPWLLHHLAGFYPGDLKGAISAAIRAARQVFNCRIGTVAPEAGNG